MHRLGTALLAFLVIPGCADETKPVPVDPADFELSQGYYACREWTPEQPQVEQGLFDIYWGTTGLEPDIGPTAEQRGSVVGAGGKIVHEFNVGMIRAIVGPSLIPTLNANWARGVPDAGQLLVPTSVLYARDIEASTDTLYIKSLGGQVLYVREGIRVIEATMPDGSIQELRDQAYVRDVRGVGVGCPDEL